MSLQGQRKERNPLTISTPDNKTQTKRQFTYAENYAMVVTGLTAALIVGSISTAIFNSLAWNGVIATLFLGVCTFVLAGAYVVPMRHRAARELSFVCLSILTAYTTALRWMKDRS